MEVKIRAPENRPPGTGWGDHRLRIYDGVEDRSKQLGGRLKTRGSARPVEDGGRTKAEGLSWGNTISKSRSISGSKTLQGNWSPASKNVTKTTV